MSCTIFIYICQKKGFEDIFSFIHVLSPFSFCNILYVECDPLEVGDIGCDTVFATAADTVYNFSV